MTVGSVGGMASAAAQREAIVLSELGRRPQHYIGGIDEQQAALLQLLFRGMDGAVTIERRREASVIIVQRGRPYELYDLRRRRSLIVPTSALGWYITISQRAKRLLFSKSLLIVSHGEMSSMTSKVLAIEDGTATISGAGIRCGILAYTDCSTLALADFNAQWSEAVCGDYAMNRLPSHMHSEAEHLSDIASLSVGECTRQASLGKTRAKIRAMAMLQMVYEQNGRVGLAALVSTAVLKHGDTGGSQALITGLFIASALLLLSGLLCKGGERLLAGRVTAVVASPLNKDRDQGHRRA